MVVIDNASTDQSLDAVKPIVASDSRVKLVENNQNVGHSEGCNIGARISNGDYIVFVDSDIGI